MSAPLRITRSSVSYHFVKWSDGGAATHGVTVTAWKSLTVTYARGR